ncbi:MAG: formate dehydrogenase subunit alpha [Thermoguttaceae bacterium]|nr:formate dehydrogenase subunit alpha [Thermoguttaceae bacterium]
MAPEAPAVLETALAAGIYVPHLCHHPDLKPAGVCRLCLVQVEGRGLAPACRTPVESGMVVRTAGGDVDKARRIAVELLIADHQGDCLRCAKNGQCELQRIAAYVGIDEQRLARLRPPSRRLPVDSSNPFFERDPNKCVLCGICVRTCQSLQGAGAIDFAFRGYDTQVSTFGGGPIAQSRCESCGECVVRCPVGALAVKNARQPSREVRTVCPYCGVGCGMYLGVQGDRIVGVRGDPESPVNRGRLCVKGRFGHGFVHHPQRLTAPLVRKNGRLVPATWDEALDAVARGFAPHRGHRFAAIASAKCTNEENYVIQKFARAVMGTNHVDHCARLCHAPSVTGLVQSLGSGAMTNSIDEIRFAACIFAIGTNTTSAHPVIGAEIRRAAQAGAKLIVANPKEIELARAADIFLQHRPGSDVALLMGMMRVIVDERLADEAFIAARCENFGPFCDSLQRFDLDTVEEITGVPREKIAQAARCYATNRPAMLFYAMGITQHTHGTDNVLATSNLALLTGNVGRPSSGVNPLRGQNNVQGACDMGALPNVLPGYQRVDAPEVRAKFESAWGCTLPEIPGLTLTEIIDAAGQGEIRALYLVGENPVLSEANARHVEEALGRGAFLVVQDIFLSETARLADVVLPAASFAEKDGTFTNTERRVQRVRKAIDPPGESKPDWWITCRIAQRLGGKGFEYPGPSEILDEIARLVPSYGGISFGRLEVGGLPWPCPSEGHPGTPILHTQRFATKDGKARFVPLEYRPPAEACDERFPLVLTTDRSLIHYHTGTMTRRVAGLSALEGEELVRMNPVDAQALGIADGDMVEVSSRRGTMRVRARLTDACPPGVVSATFHFAESRTNELTNAALDPVAKIPETKVCAVRVQRAG